METLRPAFEDRPKPEISYGLDFPQACSNALKRFKASKVYILCSGSLAKNTAALQDLSKALGQENILGVRVGLKSHTQLPEVLEVIQEAKEAGILVTLGAGSLTDAAKIVSFALANQAYTLDKLLQLTSDSPNRLSDIEPSHIPIICIPTSLSGGEYSWFAGGTLNNRKHSFGKPCSCPALVILDAALTRTTPESIWLSTGVRAIDHCVETICSLQADENSEQDARKGLALLVPNLLKTKADPEDLEARHETQMGVIHAMSACSRGVPLGASHGIGHQLGPLGVGHGETSCILLPAVSKYNSSHNKLQQDKVTRLLWDSSAGDILAKELSREADLADVLDVLFRALGMPRRLSHFGIGRVKLDALAENSLHDRWVQTNPRPLKKENVMEILEMCL